MNRFTTHSDLALMLSGGGARAAYQVGFLRLLAREFPDVVPGILTGVSAGGIRKLLTANGGHVPGIAQSLDAEWLRAVALTASRPVTRPIPSSGLKRCVR